MHAGRIVFLWSEYSATTGELNKPPPVVDRESTSRLSVVLFVCLSALYRRLIDIVCECLHLSVCVRA